MRRERFGSWKHRRRSPRRTLPRVLPRPIPQEHHLRPARYVDQACELREAIRGPWKDWAAILPQEDDPSTVPTHDHPESFAEERLHVENKMFMDDINKNPRIEFLRNCTPHMSSCAKDRILQDVIHGVNDVDGSITNGLAAAMELGLPTLRGESSDPMENNRRLGRGASAASDNR